MWGVLHQILCLRRGALRSVSHTISAAIARSWTPRISAMSRIVSEVEQLSDGYSEVEPFVRLD